MFSELILSTISAIVNENCSSYAAYEHMSTEYCFIFKNKYQLKKIFTNKLHIHHIICILGIAVLVAPAIEHPSTAQAIVGAYTLTTQPGLLPRATDVTAVKTITVQTETIAPISSLNQTALALPKLASKEALLYTSDGQILFAQNSTTELPIASLTKLMTAVVASENSQFAMPITITKDDQILTAPSIHLQKGDSVMPSDLVRAMLIGSANDAAQTLADHLPDNQSFLHAMNAKAVSLGMTSTHYTTAIGFDVPGNHSSATDLERLVNYALQKLPYNEISTALGYSFSSVNGTSYSVSTSNPLLKNHPDILAIKTGLSPEALGNMIVQKTIGSTTVTAIVLDSTNREQDTLNLLAYAEQYLHN